MLPLLIFAALVNEGPSEPREVDFAREVRPILSDKCFTCHGPDLAARKAELRLDTRAGALKGGRSGFPAVVPGDREESELWAMITSEFTSERMPPEEGGKELSADELETLGLWIDQGAEWAEHWAFVAPARAEPAPLSGDEWSQGPVDQLLLERMRQEGFEPEAPASKAKLLRRASFDLTGVPPTLEELDVFLADDTEGAWGRALDRLFASPRYGEHMGRYWLDAARYGDTHGLHLDSLRTMWLYREWVIKAFNENKPFDEFTIEQLAGDLLEDPTEEQLVATGFNRCNVTTAEGGLIAEEYLVHYAFDRVDTTSTVWMGLTMRCAKCHDHKFDPFSQKEYYEMLAFFRGLAEEASDGNAIIAQPAIQAATPEQKAHYQQLEMVAATLTAELNGPLPEIDGAQGDWEAERSAFLDEAWQTLTPTELSSEMGATLTALEGGLVQVTGENPEKDVHELTFSTALEGVRTLHFEGLPDEANAAGGLGRSVNGNVVMTGFELEAAPLDPLAGYEPVNISSVRTSFSQASFPVANVLTPGGETGWAIHPNVSQAHELIFVLEEPLVHEGGARLRLRVRYESVHARHVISRFRVSVAAMPEMFPAEQGPWFQAGPFFTATAVEAKESAFIDPADGLNFSARREVEAAPEEVRGAVAWVDDEQGNGGTTEGLWDYVTVAEGAPVHSGETSRRQEGDGIVQHFFHGASRPLYLSEGDHLYAWVHLDPEDPPQEIMLQFHVVGHGNWEHRAKWGADKIEWGGGVGADVEAHRQKGALPPAGEWVRLTVDPSEVGLGPGHAIDGIAFTQFGGVAHWDDAGVETDAPSLAFEPSLWRRVAHEDGVIQRYEQKIGAVYLARTIDVTNPREHEVRLGSDDGIWVWLNGREVHANDVARGVMADQDSLTLELIEGRNELLIKVVNGGGGFGSYYHLASEETQGETAALVQALKTPAEERDESQALALRDHFRATTSPTWRELRGVAEAAVSERDSYKAGFAQTMIMRERPEPRPTHLLMRGQYDQPAEQVYPGVPAVFPDLVEAEAPNRLALAKWLVDPAHPLTARVMVNRLWQQLFGTGIVKTSGDFGFQGEWPSHPELLDWLAVEFVESGWDIQHILRVIMSSAAYQQDSRVSPGKHALDPENRLIARGPNHRLDAEVIRDSALFHSGLLVERIGGASVKPYQPAGIWKAVGYTSSNTANFKQDSGDALYRRSLYTFWKRTAPPPALSTFDAPSREECCVKRERTNTPLQALVLLNDVQHVEAARAFAERLLLMDESDEDRLGRAFRMATSRPATSEEVEILATLLYAQRAVYIEDAEAAKALIEVGDSAPAEGIDPSVLAAWTVVSSAVLNLHEAITKG
ncbi:MAG: PSD1 and planctomycete cytochrome C domain-containing protein [Planctomycetes bacterium]|nr:PSD1 and planctomycete cytochrome C domain-containing protein [Planctomycetota bacterium]